MKLFISVLLCLSLSMAFGAKKRSGLFNAINAGDKKLVLRFLENGVHVNAKRKGKTPLMMAARYGKLDIAKIFIDKEANINAKDKSMSQTALHIAINHKHPSVALLLIKKGAFVNERPSYDVYTYPNSTAHWTPLHLAVRREQVKVVQRLLEAGALVNAMDDIHKTPLHFAATQHLPYIKDPKAFKDKKKEQLDIVKLLLKSGGHMNARNLDGWTPLHYAAELGHDEIAKLLADKGANINAQDKDGHRPFHVALSRIRKEDSYDNILGMLIVKGADLKFYLGYYMYSGFFSSSSVIGYLPSKYVNRFYQRLNEQVQQSIKKGASINGLDDNGLTFLHWAAIYNHQPLVKWLLANKANVNPVDFSGKTPLDYLGYYDIRYWPINKTRELLKKAGGLADISSQLIHAVQNDQVQRVNELIEKGAGRIIRFNLTKSLIGLAKSEAMKKLIHKAGGKSKLDHLLYNTINVKDIQMFIKQGADVNSVFYSIIHYTQASRIHSAARSENLKLVKALVNNGANINAMSKGDVLHGGTPLHWAIYNYGISRDNLHKASVVQFLLMKGANFKARLTGGRYQGATPLHLAMVNMSTIRRSEKIMKFKQGYKVIQSLIKHGADIHAQIKDGPYKGETPLHWAMNKGLTSVVRLLINQGAKLNAPNHYGMRPLFWALNAGYYKLAKRMIQKGANVRIRNKYRQTLLHLAVACRQTKIVKLLIQKGAKINVRDKSGKSPVDYAKSDGIRAILK